jgi:hypothetical protein
LETGGYGRWLLPPDRKVPGRINLRLRALSGAALGIIGSGISCGIATGMGPGRTAETQEAIKMRAISIAIMLPMLAFAGPSSAQSSAEYFGSESFRQFGQGDAYHVKKGKDKYEYKADDKGVKYKWERGGCKYEYKADRKGSKEKYKCK